MTTTTATPFPSDHDDMEDIPSLSSLFQTCTSITHNALSLKAFALNSSSKNEHIDAAIDQEAEIAAWLDRQMLDYDSTTTTTPAKEVTQSTADALLESTWSQEYIPRLLMERVAMSVSAQAAQQESATSTQSSAIGVLTQEALSSRNALVDQVVAVQSQISEVQDELENTSSQCRQAQAENRALHKALQQLQQQQSKERDKDATSEELERRSRLLKRVVADLIVGADLDLYSDARLAVTLRKLE
jgi:hypothetical protein